MATSSTLTLPVPTSPNSKAVHWFAAGACVVGDADEEREVWIGGSLVARLEVGDRPLRNALLLGLAQGDGMHLGHLATAFGVTTETLRILRQIAERDGVMAALSRAQTGRPKALTEVQHKKLITQFEAGIHAAAAHKAIKSRASRRTVERARAEWLAGRETTSPPAVAPSAAATRQPELVLSEAPAEPVNGVSAMDSVPAEDEASAETPPAASGSMGSGRQGCEEEPAQCVRAASDDASSPGVAGSPFTPAMREFDDDKVSNAGTAVRSARGVQHLGAWLMVAMVARLGLFARAAGAGKDRVNPSTLRIAIESVVTALAIGERCVEGVRRLQSRTAGALLRAQWAPSATWTRRVLGAFSRELGGFLLHLSMAGGYLRELHGTPKTPVVLYIDNHLRRYTGKVVIRKGWRMQDKRAVPGTMDYYVHDEDGRPLLRFAVPENEPLTEWLPRIARTLRDVLDADESMILAFDRAGAFPEHMAGLRDEDFSFVTYERRPYARVPSSELTAEMNTEEGTLRYRDKRMNLGKGRGRLRRIALEVPDEKSKTGTKQINLLAAGKAEAEVLISALQGRWIQENGLKHGAARWGINQLDGRTTVPYPEDALIPNPARRRLDRALRAARLREGMARSALVKLPSNSAKRALHEQDLKEALADQSELEAQRPSVPPKALLKDTELSGILERHPDEYKVTLDAIRFACANAESELATHLGTHMKRPAEAKKLLANLLKAPGRIHTSADYIDVCLQLSGTAQDQAAQTLLLQEVNKWKLCLPGADAARPLRFSAQT